MNEFVEYLHELLHDFGPIQAKKMFGGYGIYHQGLMFGLVADEAKHWARLAYAAALRAKQKK